MLQDFFFFEWIAPMMFMFMIHIRPHWTLRFNKIC